VQAVFLRRSRDCILEKYLARKAECEQLNQRLEQKDREIEELRRCNEKLSAERDALQREASQRRAAAQGTEFEFDDPPLGQHGFGARMVSLCLQLVKQSISLRGVERVLRIVFEVLAIRHKVPHWTTIRLWLQRLGHGVLTAPTEKADDWVWLMDHSVQIGQEKTLVVLGVRAAQLPPAGQALKHEDVHPLAVLPRVCWKREDVHAALTELVKERGVPRAIVTDHGVDLLGGIQLLQQQQPQIVELYDFKHKAACCLKALLEKDEPFQQFQKHLGQTRSAIQQTELGFLTPPGPKSKARFMNLGPSLAWACKMLRLLDHPSPKAQQWVTRQRLETKLGWLRSFREALTQWSDCQRVVNVGVKFANEQGIFRGAAEQLRAAMPADLQHQASRDLRDQLVAFVATQEAKLNPGERLPLSTEIVESSFAKYKNLERQHSKQGFTGLLLAFAALLTRVTPEKIRATFATSLVRNVRHWIRDHLGPTLASKRTIAYRDCKPPDRATATLQAA
jgi:hypothetical protein